MRLRKSLLLATAASLVVPSVSRSKDPEEWLAQARQSRERGQITDAIRQYQKALSAGCHLAEPLVEAQAGKCEMLMGVDDWATATEACQRSWQLSIIHGECLTDLQRNQHALNAFRIAMKFGRYSDAEARIRDITKLSPENPAGHYNLGVLLNDIGRPNEALPALEKAVQLFGDEGDVNMLYNAIATIGLSYIDVGKLDRAIHVLRYGLNTEALKDNYMLGHHLRQAERLRMEQSGQLPQSYSHLDKTVDSDPVGMACLATGEETESCDLSLTNIKKLKTKELRAFIRAAGLTFDDCVEKSDLRRRAAEARELLLSGEVVVKAPTPPVRSSKKKGGRGSAMATRSVGSDATFSEEVQRVSQRWRRDAQSMLNEYTGFQPYEGWTVPELIGHLPSDLEFRQSIRSRTPFLVRGEGGDVLQDMGWKTARWTPQFLRSALRSGSTLDDDASSKAGRRSRSNRTKTTKARGPQITATTSVHVNVAHHPDGRFGIFGGPGTPGTNSTTRGWEAHRRIVDWQHFIDTVFMDEGSCADEPLEGIPLPCGDAFSYYFAIQPNIDQNDEQPYEFPLSEPRLKNDIPLPLIPTPALSSSNLWFGRSAASADGDTCAPIHTHLHNDPMDNVYVLIQGTKRFRIYSPADVLNLDVITPPKSIRSDGYIDWTGKERRYKGYRFSHVPGEDYYDPSLAQEFPEWGRGAVGTVVTLYAGDILYLPRGWYHEVHTDCEPDRGRVQLAINHWFDPGAALQSPTIQV